LRQWIRLSDDVAALPGIAASPQDVKETTVATVRIRADGERHLSFEVLDDGGGTLATSWPFDSICRLEAALGTLSAALRESWHVGAERAVTTVFVGQTRRRVRLRGNVSRDQVWRALAAVAVAKIVDDRPARSRRQDLTGLKHDFSY